MTQEPLPSPKANNAVRDGKTASTASPLDFQNLSDRTQVEQQVKQPRSLKQLAALSVSDRQRQTKLLAGQQRQGWSLKVKAITLALAASMLPVLAVGTASILSSQSIRHQVSEAKYTGTARLAETEVALQRQLLSLALGTGAGAVLAGALAAFLINRTLRPVLNAAAASTTVVNKLRREDMAPSASVAAASELAALEANLSIIEEQLPSLLGRQEVEAERAQTLMNLTRRIWGSLSKADVLKTTVEEVRTALKADRVTILRFDANGNGTFIEESVAFGLSKMLGAKVDTPFLEDMEQYRNSRVLAMDNIYQAGLTDSHIEFLEQFGVKTYLSAPIIKDNQLFGLLVAYQCSKPRYWQQPEINLFAHLAAQVGFALERAGLLEQVDTKANQAQVFIDIAHQIRQSLSEEDILKTTVEEVRKAMRTDRVLIYGFDADWYGTVIAESVLPGFPKAVWAQIKDPCFAQGYVAKYQAGRIAATSNIYEAGLTACHIKQLESFGVKANLVAPILKDGHLFGLLIAHECSKPRFWQQSEIDLFAQVATQVGFALDHARLLQRIDAEGLRNQLLAYVTHQIRESLNEEDILKTTVEEVRKAMRTDRVIIYGFDADWYGTVVAESVLPGLPKALWANIKDPCFAQGYVAKYRAGRVQAINDVYTAGLTECYLKQLEPFGVKANLVAPILKDGHLFGLLIAHECYKPRDWQQPEINLFAQLATQVGFALDHARLLNQVEQAYQAATVASEDQRQQKEALQRQVTEMVRGSEIVKTLSDEMLTKMECVKAAYHHIQAVADAAQKIIATVQQAEYQIQQAEQIVQSGHEIVSQTVNGMVATRQAILEVAQNINQLEPPAQKLTQVVDLINNTASQLKLQAMNIKLATSRSNRDDRQEFASIAEKVLTSTQQLEAQMTEIELLVTKMQVETHAATATIEVGRQAIAPTQLLEEAEQKLNQITAFSIQMISLIEEIASVAGNQTQASTQASIAIMEVASAASKTSEQSMAMAESFTQLATAHES